jgi:hypothetical protein
MVLIMGVCVIIDLDISNFCGKFFGTHADIFGSFPWPEACLLQTPSNGAINCSITTLSTGSLTIDTSNCAFVLVKYSIRQTE